MTDIGVRVVVLGAKAANQNISSVRRGLEGFERQTRSLSGGITRFGNTLSSVGRNISAFGQALTIGITLPVTAAATALVGAGIKFEDAFSGVTKTVEGTVIGFDEVAESLFGVTTGLSDAQKEAVFAHESFGELTNFGRQLRDDFKDLSEEIPVSAVELANIAEIAGQLGVPLGENGQVLRDFTRDMALMGVATNLTSEQAATSIARIANIFGVADDEMSEFSKSATAAIVDLGNNFATTEREIVEMAFRISGAGNALGFTTQEILGIAAALSSVGVKPEMGGSAVSRIFLEMSSAVADFSDTSDVAVDKTAMLESELNRLRTALSSGKTDMFDLELAMGSTFLELGGISGEMRNLTGDSLTLNQVMSNISQRTMTALIKKLDRGTLSQEEFDAAVVEASGNLEVLRGRLASGERNVDLLKNTFAATDIVFTGIAKDLRLLDAEFSSVDDIIQYVRQNTLAKLNEEAEVTESQLALMAQAAGLTEKRFAELVKASPLSAFKLLTEGLAEMQESGTLTSDMMTDLNLNSIRLRQVINSLGPNMNLLDEAIDTSNMSWEEQVALQEEAQKKFKTTQAQITILRNKLSNLGSTIFLLVKDDLDKLIGSLGDLIDKFETLPVKAQKTILLFAGIAAAIGPVLVVLGTFISSFGSVISAIGGIAGIGGALGSIGIGGLTSLMSMLAPLAPVLIPLAAAFAAIKFNLFGIGDLAADVAAEFNNFLEMSGVADILGVINYHLTLIHASLGPVIDRFKVAVAFFKQGDFSEGVAQLKLTWETLVAWFNIEGKQLLENAFRGIVKVSIETLTELGPKVLDWLKEKVPEIQAKLGEWGAAFIDWLGPVLEGLPQKLVALYVLFEEWFLENFPKILADLLDLSNAFVVWLQDSIDGLGPKLADFILLIGGFLADIIFQAFEQTPALVSAFLQFIDDMIFEVGPKFLLFVANVIGLIALFIGEIFLAFYDVGEAVVNGLIDGLSEAWPALKGEFVKLIDSVPLLGDAIEFIGTGGGLWGGQQGGYTGNAPSNQVTGVVHGREWVIPTPGGPVVFSSSLTAAINSLTHAIDLMAMPHSSVASAGGNTVTNINTSTFAPNVTGVPMTGEQDMSGELVRLYNMAALQ